MRKPREGETHKSRKESFRLKSDKYAVIKLLD